ncbi:MAG: aminoacetone oxidase family FAD-binding enzyme, partial [Limnohabitans sp.]|nr:aminoacetone oxidase family FAD-binding enzyme [Limnohabitans sp.]
MKSFDVVIVGAGAAGLFCAGVAAQQGLQVLLIDHSEKVAEKIRISGGGRSNFTNRELDVRAPHKHFLGDNPQFCRSALSRYTPQDFVALVQKHNIPFHEKHKGQLFCDRSAEDLIQLLLAECHGSANGGNVTRWQPCSLKELRYADAAPEAQRYTVDTSQGSVCAAAVVIATGGLSIPKIGATDLGYRLAKQFNLRVVEPRPGLVPLTFDGAAWAPYAQLAGLSLPVRIETGTKKTLQSFDEDLLFTHRGLSGPGVLQISSYWQAGSDIRINLAPDVALHEALMQAKQRSKKLIANELHTWVPGRLAEAWVNQEAAWQRPVIEASDKA